MTDTTNHETVIIAGGTFNHIRNHLSLAAPAFGATARQLWEKFSADKISTTLTLTKMAGGEHLNTNEDVSKYVDLLLKNDNVKTIIFNAAICDYEAEDIDGIPNGSHAKRLLTKDGAMDITIKPSEKIIARIRQQRPDIFLVGFKTTTDKSKFAQYYTALKFMKKTKCNLVLANDTVTRNNIVIVPEEAYYYSGTNRKTALHHLYELIKARQNLTYNHTTFFKTPTNHSMKATPDTFQHVIWFLVNNGGFISDNGNDFTPGHFCYKVDKTTFLSSQRKTDHNKIYEQGLTLVHTSTLEDNVLAIGNTKPSVGATSQQLLFKAYPEYDCIVHTHNPLKQDSDINIVPQHNYQCGSIECGQNTVNGMQFKDDIGAVFLDKHGANIMFKSTDQPMRIIDFITDNIKLDVKVK